MKVKVVRTEAFPKKKDGSNFEGCSAVVIFPDGETAAKLYIGEEVIAPDDVIPGAVYDLYRDKNDFVLVFNLLQLPKE